ncbi:dihydrofolate reductase family protein [Agromyces sp. LHK192]|uniref:dihydrofolate reductase family protein n=1 Tax=Agromyces sp. LHK192 TaxID=2498704 RepID=UPI000FDBC46B|nr:dihydrofolate reductase family protein [Agromyces sp. LHK192]
MGRLIVEQVVTVDGYASDAEGGIAFFEAVEGLEATDVDQLHMLEDVDAMLLGRVTYEMFAAYWPTADPADDAVAEPIARLAKHVVTSTLADAPWGDAGSIEMHRGDGVAAARAIADATPGGVIVWGSLTLADDLLRAGAVDELRLRIVPVLIGAGRSFTPPDLGERRLELDHAVTHPSGHVTLHYRLR